MARLSAPEQFEPERINRSDVQELLQKVHVDTRLPFHKPVTVAGMLDPYTIAALRHLLTSTLNTLSFEQHLEAVCTLLL